MYKVYSWYLGAFHGFACWILVVAVAIPGSVVENNLGGYQETLRLSMVTTNWVYTSGSGENKNGWLEFPVVHIPC